MTDETRLQLRAFVERAERVLRSSYVKHVMEQPEPPTITMKTVPDQGFMITNNLPDEEARDALLLTARMFVQNKDSVSFGSMAKLDGDPGLSQEWKDRMNAIRSALNTRLDKPSWFHIDGVHCTERDIFNTLLYGHFAHSDEKYVAKYRTWRANPLGYPYIDWQFHMTLLALLRAVNHLLNITVMELNGEPIPPLTP